ncbi:MAG: 4-alpha-glucanotransferase [Clostridiales bacterium]|nr:4-alpha-glucanotransferase [Clostridiales bacterium]
MNDKRKSGILLHISSLPSPHGIGTLGQCAREFADFLKSAGQSYWQILPVCPTDSAASPYRSYSSFAGNPNFIDLDMLYEDRLLKKSDYKDLDFGKAEESVNFKKLEKSRARVFKTAFEAFTKKVPTEFYEFCEKEDYWLGDFSLFMAERDQSGGKAWADWQNDIKTRKPKETESEKQRLKKEIQYYKMLQYLFYRQWGQFKQYVNSQGVEIIGDLPIYVSCDSADVWAAPQNFFLDSNCRPVEVAGCPPDSFTPEGQLWGNPLYDWDYMRRDNYSWWVKRISHATKLYDVIRIDHFRGFESYYAIDAAESTAVNGVWKKGPGADFFDLVRERLGKLNIIAEDLGYLTPAVKELLEHTGFAGMNVLQFAFDGSAENEYLPHNYEKNSIAYTGTHDNDTLVGFIKNAAPHDIDFACKYLNSPKDELNSSMIRAVWASTSRTAVAQAQDILGLGSYARMNTPSTVGANWRWRAKPGAFCPELGAKLYDLTRLYGRLNNESGL